MAEILSKDKYGRAVTVLTEGGKDRYDIYGTDGTHHFNLSFPAGWPLEKVYFSIESMPTETVVKESAP